MAIQLHYQPHEKRKKEAAFVQELIQLWDITDVIPCNFPLPPLSGSIDLTSLLLQLETNLPEGKRWPLLLGQLKQLPPQIKLFQSTSQISCDVVIVKDGKPYFIEYHEKQHYKLTDNRLKRVYTLSDEPIYVPRYVQRFLRDIWRIQNLHPLTIVWDDTFLKDGISEFIHTENNVFEFGEQRFKAFYKAS